MLGLQGRACVQSSVTGNANPEVGLPNIDPTKKRSSFLEGPIDIGDIEEREREREREIYIYIL